MKAKEEPGAMLQLLAAVFSLVLALPQIAAAQSSGTAAEFAAVVVLPDGSLVQQLDKDGFVAENKGGRAQIESVEEDTGPRRLLFVIETGSKVPTAARKIESAVISELVKKARPDDVIGLLTARGPERKVGFGGTKADLLGAADEIGNGIRGKNQDNGVLDSILEGTQWFTQPQRGDAIFVLAMGIEKYNKTSYSRVKEALLNRHIRVFGLQLGMVIAGFYSVGWGMSPYGGFIPRADIDPNREDLFTLSLQTGGFATEENAEGDPQRTYKLTDERLRFVEQVTGQMYKAIARYYRIRVANPTDHVTLDLAEPIRQQLPKAVVIFARVDH